MSEKPILFNSEMVRAILEGRKTQTRRPIKLGVLANNISSVYLHENGLAVFDVCKGIDVIKTQSPYSIGDILWVREKWRIIGWMEGEPYYLQYFADGAKMDEPGDSNDYDEDKYTQYSIDCSDDCEKAGLEVDEDGVYTIHSGMENPTRWRPSIFMPRWASRINLRVTNVRVERLHDINEKDLIADLGSPEWTGDGPEPYKRNLKTVFCHVWNYIYSKRGYGWNVNPWVWVYEFERKK